jgi:hypothetical protein
MITARITVELLQRARGVPKRFLCVEVACALLRVTVMRPGVGQ